MYKKFENKLFYTNDASRYTLENEVNRAAGEAYAVLALSKYDSDFNVEMLNRMNCYYGIIETDNISNLDLNDNSIYLYRNFDGVSVPNDYYIRSYTINSKTIFRSSDKFYSLGEGNQYNYIYTDEAKQTQTYDIQGIGYDTAGGRAYVYANDRYYALLTRSYKYSDNNEESAAESTNNIYSQIWAAGRADAEEENDEKLYIEGKAYDPISKTAEEYTLDLRTGKGPGTIYGDKVADLSPIHLFLNDIDEYVSLQDISTIVVNGENPNNKHYTFICFPNETKLAEKGHENDYYAQAKKIVKAELLIKNMIPTIAVIAAVMTLICLALFIFAAGHERDIEGIVEGPLEKIPLDMSLLLTVIVEVIAVLLIRANVGILCTVLAFLSAIAIGLFFCSTAAINFKARKIFKNNMFLKWLRKLNWKSRVWTVYGIITVLEAFFYIFGDFFGALYWRLFGGYTYYSYYYGGGIYVPATRLIPWLIEKVILALILHWIIKSYSRIKETSEKLAAGDTTAHVDIDRMPQAFAETGKAINDIRAGIEVALEEQTKSERMKVELITNVSHDIKTPLTSIINYIDLLEKEKIENKNVTEYLEVLDRQSQRLKKLVIDIVEVSRATTGNISYEMERVNAVVLLDQSIGEFSERLNDKKIELVTGFPDEDLYLQADNRYLWRVFDNLMDNIVKYSQPGTRAYVDLENGENVLRFIFKNTSKAKLNISADELMERFVRGDKSRYTEGNGLGLSIARSLTEGMGGRIKIDIDGDFFKVILEFDSI